MRTRLKVFFFGLMLFALLFLPVLNVASGSQPNLIKGRGTGVDLMREMGQGEKLNYRGLEIPVYNGTGAPLSLAQQKVILGIIDDFRVNDDTRAAYQQYPAIAVDGSGNFVVTWEDFRNSNVDIYLQRYNSAGTRQGTNVKVNDDTGTSNHYSAAIAMDGSGDFVITWVDSRNGNPDIYFQRYNSAGTPQGSNVKVNDDAGTASQQWPAIAMDGSGDFVITWMDYRNGNWDIYFQRYNSTGTPQGSNVKVNDDAGTAYQWVPAIAMDGSGDFVITWEDTRNGNYDVYFQRYNSAGTRQGTNVKVNDDAGTSDQGSPAIAVNGSGNFVITWMDRRSGNWDIYFQRYNSTGTPQNSNVKVNDDAGTSYHGFPAIAADGSGNFVITWEDQRNSNFDVYLQRYDSAGTRQGTNVKVNDDTGTAAQEYPAIAVDGSGEFVITWMDCRNGDWDIYLQRYNSTGNAQGSNVKVNDNAGTADHYSPSIAVDGSGNFIITWQDQRSGNWDIYFQRYDSSGTAQGSNIKVNDDVAQYDQEYPAIAMDSSGNFVIAWQDLRNENWDIYFQRYNSSGIAQGSNVIANDDGGFDDQLYPAIAVNGPGNFIITWIDFRNGNWDTYFQRYTSTGTPQGTNVKVNNAGTADQGSPAVSLDGSGNFVIAWADDRSGNLDIYYQRYNSSGTAQGSNLKVNDDAGSPAQEYPAVATDDSGNFVITWQDLRNENWDIYSQRYNSSGITQGSNVKVNDDGGFDDHLYPAIAMSGSGKYLISWEDKRNGNPDIYAQRYNSAGKLWGKNYLVCDSLYADYDQERPSVGLSDSNVYFSWQDDRNGNWDIYAKVVDWTWPAINGDDNADGSITVSDVVYLINYLFKAGHPPKCPPAPYLTCGDANRDSKVTVSDVIYLVNYLFKGGPKPAY